MDRDLFLYKKLLGFLYTVKNQIFLRGIAGGIFKHPAQVRAVQTAVIGNILYFYRLPVFFGDVFDDTFYIDKRFVRFFGCRSVRRIVDQEMEQAVQVADAGILFAVVAQDLCATILRQPG